MARAEVRIPAPTRPLRPHSNREVRVAKRRREASERELPRQPPLLHLRPRRPVYRRSLRPDSGGLRPRTQDGAASKLKASDREVRAVLGASTPTGPDREVGLGIGFLQHLLTSTVSGSPTPMARVPKAAANGLDRALSAPSMPKRAERGRVTNRVASSFRTSRIEMFLICTLSRRVRVGNHCRGLFVFFFTLRVARETFDATACNAACCEGDLWHDCVSFRPRVAALCW